MTKPTKTFSRIRAFKAFVKDLERAGIDTEKLPTLGGIQNDKRVTLRFIDTKKLVHHFKVFDEWKSIKK